VLESFARRGPLLTPSEEEWAESGQLLTAIRKCCSFETHKLRDLHFDVLIALTARTLITSNRADFELIREYCDFRLEVW